MLQKIFDIRIFSFNFLGAFSVLGKGISKIDRTGTVPVAPVICVVVILGWGVSGSGSEIGVAVSGNGSEVESWVDIGFVSVDVDGIKDVGGNKSVLEPNPKEVPWVEESFLITLADRRRFVGSGWGICDFCDFFEGDVLTLFV